MIIQGSPEWYKEREGNLTASRFADVLAKPTTKRYQNYQNEILCDLMGVPNFESEQDEKPWFRHGKEYEPIARARYEYEQFLIGNDIEVQEVGLLVHSEYDFISCSPDGLPIPKKGLEIKSHISHSAYEQSVKSGLPAKNKAQVQGSLWISGFEEWDFVSFFRDPDGMKKDEINIITVLPDLKYHDLLKEKCLNFWKEIQARLN